jgi:hypothetical protein
MKRLAIAAVVLASLGAGLAILSLWLAGAAWPDGATTAFCKALEPWHAAQTSFVERGNSPGSRDKEGLGETLRVYYESARLPLPEAHSEREKALREVLRSTVRVEEEWLTELNILNAVTSSTAGTSVSQRLEAVRIQEAKRLELNDLLREANALLGQVCGLPPLPIYSSG